MAGDMDLAHTRLRQALAQDTPLAGLVQFIDARGPADLVTLRTARALAAADVLVCDDGVDPEVLALGRRDAERLAPPAATLQRLDELTRQGLRVARLVADAGWRAELERLTAAGVETEVLPIAGY
jgi:precorrin-2 dehydrogenase/sirohydrochlorin ferrochelatase